MANRLAAQADFIGPARFQGRLYDLGTYPGVIASPDPADSVMGDLYALRQPERLLATLDNYEGYRPDQPAASLYLRKLAPIALLGGADHTGWIYLYNRPVYPDQWIASGDYLRHLQRVRAS
jgi:gamma-glutamylcyclotransferase (GGCT)/AIG2-like uncharacterized protein YtfP